MADLKSVPVKPTTPAEPGMHQKMYARRLEAVAALTDLVKAQTNTYNARVSDGPAWKDVLAMGNVMTTLGVALVQLGMTNAEVEREFRALTVDKV